MSVLVDLVRRALYEHVRRQRGPVSREDAAQAVGISRGLAAFHLDRLVEAGLLEAGYAEPAGPRGRGRAPKVYRASDAEVSLLIPERRYDLAGEILAEAVARQPDDAGQAALRIAHERGVRCGQQAGGRRGTGPERTMARAAEVLAGLGFEPERGADEVVLRNCPFHALAQRQRELICGVNLAFVEGTLAGLGGAPVRAELAPGPDRCCVRLSAAP